MNKARVKMPVSQRAKQFQAFDALKGFKEAIAAKEVQRVPKRELAEDGAQELNCALRHLEKNQAVRVVYYDSGAQNYLQVTGSVSKVDSYRRTLIIGDVRISFSEIMQLDHRS